MTKIAVLRTNEAMPPDLSAVSQFLFHALDGFRAEDRKAWRRIWRRIQRMEPGELLNIDVVIPRNAKFHRKFFALLTVGFDAWDGGRKHRTYKGQPVKKDFEQFREDVTIMAGFFEQTFDLRGHMKLKAKSISFANMEDPEFEKLYGAVADVLLETVLTNYAGRAELDRVVAEIERFRE